VKVLTGYGILPVMDLFVVIQQEGFEGLQPQTAGISDGQE